MDKQLLEHEQRMPDFRNVVCVAIYTKMKLRKKKNINFSAACTAIKTLVVKCWVYKYNSLYFL